MYRVAAILAVFVIALAVFMAGPPKADPVDVVADLGLEAGVVAFGTVDQPPRVFAFGGADETARMPLASLTKPITAALVLELDRRGLLGLDDRLADYLPAGPDHDPRYGSITLRHLVDHRSGLYRMSNPENSRAEWAVDAEDCSVFVRLSTLPMTSDPGKVEAYSNLGYCLLGLVIEHATGKPYVDVVPDVLGIDAVLVDPVYGAFGGLAVTATDYFGFVAGLDPNLMLGWRVDGETRQRVGALSGVSTVAIRRGDRVFVGLFTGKGDPYLVLDEVRRRLHY